MKKIYVLLLAVLGSLNMYAQSNFGEIRGQITDAKTKQPLDYATIVVSKEGINKGGGFSDENGKYYIKGLDPGSYELKVTYQGYTTYRVEGVEVSGNQITKWNISMSQDVNTTDEVVVVKFRKPLIKDDENSKSFTDEDIKKLPTRSVQTIAGTSSGANRTAGGGVSFIGQRTDGTAYFVDGVQVIGATTFSQAGIDQIDIIQSGVPAQYGDFTGGAISVTTKGPTRKFNKSLEMISSSPFDGYHFNQIEASMSGPLWIKNKGGGDKEYVKLGYQLAGQFNYQKDYAPSAFATYEVKEDKLAEIENNPLTLNPNGGGFVTTSSFLTKDDLEEVKYKSNIPYYRGLLQGKLEFQPSKNTTVSLFGSGNYVDRSVFNYTQALMNYKENPQQIDQTYRTYLKFTQRLKQDEKDTGSFISNVFYSVRLDYQTRFLTTQHAEHKDNIFDYGYLGKFTRYRSPAYTYQDPREGQLFVVDENNDGVMDTVRRRGYWELVGFADTLLTFERSDLNPFRANYTSNLYDQYADLGGTIRNEFTVQQNQGLLNGFSVPNTYGLWVNPGNISANYSKSQVERFTAFAMGEAQLGKGENKHDIQFGVTYQQSMFSGYSLGATGLWRLMAQKANAHISELDKVSQGDYILNSIHSYDEFGRFTDTVRYNVRLDKDQQSDFDRNLREKLISDGATDIYGNPVTETSFIDVNALDPETYSIDLFSANDLWNNGSSYVSYYGYDYKGNRTRKAFSIEDFTDDEQNRSIGSFAPVYGAVWLQDKFAFKDLIFRVGVRIERYDANQPVLKDPYSLYPVKTVGEVRDEFNAIPENIGDDYVVYVRNSDNPTATDPIGFRDGSTWYNANGTQITNPQVLAEETVNGLIQPYLVDPQNEEVVAESFKDYDPKINVLPRIWFSFPITTEAQFFANYDVLAQRPNDGATFAPINTYYYLQQVQGGVIANSALEPRLRTNYELGFKQKLSDRSAINIIASYSETRGDFGLMRVQQAYPIDYTTYSNIDFQTVKSFRLEYELRGLDRLSITANYALLFADGTGSNINSQQALIQANQPNLRSLYPLEVDIRHNITTIFDYRFEDGKDYRGPMIGKNKIFAGAGANLIVNAQSGAPYTADLNPTATASFGAVTRSQIKGNPYGSRLPWQFKIDANIQKNFQIEKKKKKDFHSPVINMTAFLWVQNLLDSRIVQGVYAYTGLPNDDGYLNSPQGQQDIETQINAQSYMDLYEVKMNNPFNYGIPRLIRIGLRMYF